MYPTRPEDRDAYRKRRQVLQQELQRRGLEAAALVAGWARPRNFAHNVFPFRAESHFLHCLGSHLEGAVLLFRGDEEPTLFVSEREPEMDLWAGPEPGLDQLAELLSIRVEPMSEFSAPAEVATIPPQDDETALWLGSLLDRSLDAQSGDCLSGMDEELAEAMVAVRLVHDDLAVRELSRAAELSAAAHRAGMRATRGREFEYEVRGRMEGELLTRGAFPAYTSIVTQGGEVLHQSRSQDPLASGSLLLADVGGETSLGYAGDITRTWPISGKFSATQRVVYEAVLSVQKAAVSRARAHVRYLELHQAAQKDLLRRLLELGIVRGEVDDLYERGVSAVFFPHGLGHLLGLDVHDMEDLGDRAGYGPLVARSSHPAERALRLHRELVSGQVVTIEPGFYLSPLLLFRARENPLTREAIAFDELEKFSDVRGIRIEDDVLIQDDCAMVLSSAAPKEVAEVEQLLAAGPGPGVRGE